MRKWKQLICTLSYPSKAMDEEQFKYSVDPVRGFLEINRRSKMYFELWKPQINT